MKRDFRYRVALGDLILEIGSKNFSTHWGWVPLIDLPASFLRHIAKKLQHSGRTETFGSPNQNRGLRFSRQGTGIIITGELFTWRGQVEYARFCALRSKIKQTLRDELLQRNSHFRRTRLPAAAAGGDVTA